MLVFKNQCTAHRSQPACGDGNRAEIMSAISVKVLALAAIVEGENEHQQRARKIAGARAMVVRYAPLPTYPMVKQ